MMWWYSQNQQKNPKQNITQSSLSETWNYSAIWAMDLELRFTAVMY
jgi:hypothetical protein